MPEDLEAGAKLQKVHYAKLRGLNFIFKAIGSHGKVFMMGV